jgi:hypothetical protein
MSSAFAVVTPSNDGIASIRGNVGAVDSTSVASAEPRALHLAQARTYPTTFHDASAGGHEISPRGVLFLVWTPFSWWAAVTEVAVSLLSYRFGILPRAATLGRLIGTSYDLHRMKLYDALRLPRPTSPDDERSVGGPRLTHAVAGTLVEPGLTYRFEPPTESLTAEAAERESSRTAG